jgi:hypothetical protein
LRNFVSLISAAAAAKKKKKKKKGFGNLRVYSESHS